LVFRAFDPELEFPKHEHFTRLQAKAGDMAPTRSEDLMMQLMVKIEEGNREMQKRMDLLQTTMTGMEVTMKGVVSEQIGFQKWKPEMEKKLKDLTETLKDVQMKVDQVALNLPSISSAGGVQIEKGVPASAHMEATVSGKAPGPNCHHLADIHRRPGVTENLRTPAPVEGMQQTVGYFPSSIDWGSVGRNSIANWSQMSGPTIPNMSFPVFDGTNPKLWKHRCETYFEFYAVPVEVWVRMATMYFEGSAVF
jgi:hypothetical protein